MALAALLCAAALLIPQAAPAANDPVHQALVRPILEPGTASREVRAFCRTRVLPMPEPRSPAEWQQYADSTRQAVLDNVVLGGEAANWSKLPLNVEWLETIEGGPEYRIRKLRYEAVPGMWIPALLYEPRQLEGKVPVALCVNGHDARGKAVPYKQARCINLAKRGMLVLNPEWLGMGQLYVRDFEHYRMNQLDLCGTSGLAPFYLAMSRGLDLLLQHPHADPERVAVSGLSGGGWQTIIISALDPRVTLSNPVAGYSSFITRGEFTKDLGDSEQAPVDLAVYADYVQLTALRAPQPTLLTYNDRDECCFEAGYALPPLLGGARPIYQLFGKLENLVAHINHVPGTHNFDQDNREAFYRMVGEHFFPDQPFDWRDIDCSGEIKTAEQLHVPLPEDNAGFNTLARRLLADLPRTSADTDPDRQRARLAELTRCREYAVNEAELLQAEKSGDVQLHAWRLRIGDSWTVPVFEAVPGAARGTTVIVADGGRAASADRVSELVQAGHRVVVVEPFGFGESLPTQRADLFSLMISAVGERALGVQSAQIRAVCRWLVDEQQTGPVTLLSIGRRTGLAALVAAAIDNRTIARLRAEDSLTSLKQLIEEDQSVQSGPELFCFGLLAEFDIPQMTALVAGGAQAAGQ